VCFDSLTKICLGETFVQQLFVLHCLCFWTKWIKHSARLYRPNDSHTHKHTHTHTHTQNSFEPIFVSVSESDYFVFELFVLCLKNIDSKESFVYESFGWFCLCLIFFFWFTDPNYERISCLGIIWITLCVLFVWFTNKKKSNFLVQKFGLSCFCRVSLIH